MENNGGCMGVKIGQNIAESGETTSGHEGMINRKKGWRRVQREMGCTGEGELVQIGVRRKDREEEKGSDQREGARTMWYKKEDRNRCECDKDC